MVFCGLYQGRRCIETLVDQEKPPYINLKEEEQSLPSTVFISYTYHVQFYVRGTEWHQECCKEVQSITERCRVQHFTVFQSKELSEIQYKQTMDLMTILFMAEEN